MNSTQIFSIISLLILACSCTEEIDINLNDAEPQLLIEGLVATNSKTTIQLSQSTNFNDNNTFPPVSNALIELSDNSGDYEALQEYSPGFYTSSALTGKIGNIYRLKVTSNNETYTSTCQIPQQVPLDSISISQEADNSFFNNDNDSIYKVTVYYKDPAGIENYYQFVEYRNSERIRSYVSKDKHKDGIEVKNVLNYRDRELEKGDTVKIEMRCISAEVYEYFNDLHSSSRMSATPTNPKTNIQNARIGYFSAHTSETKFIIYQ